MASNLDRWRHATVGELAADFVLAIASEQRERHQIYASALAAIVAHYFNGKKSGPTAEYPLAPSLPDSRWSCGAYIGHNIGALAVDGHGHIIDCAMNHNEFFQSSVEHAEARLLRRVFSLAEIYDTWALHESGTGDYSTRLFDVSIYTSLESCSQCSGMMTLAGVKEVVYLQDDPGMYKVGNILRRLSEVPAGAVPYLQAPLPVPGRACNLPVHDQLDSEFARFVRAQQARQGLPFSREHGSDKWTTSITSFLCTDPAYRAFEAQAKSIETPCNYPGYRPSVESLSNEEARQEAISFVEYVRRRADRASAGKT